MISSNISDVIARLQRLKTEIPAAMSKAFDASSHKEKMMDRVRNIGTSISGWNEDDEKAFSQILSTLEVAQTDGGLQIAMSTDLPQTGERKFPTRETIREWIDSGEKEIDDERDRFPTGSEHAGELDYHGIMGRIYGSLQKEPDKWFNSTNPTRLIKMSGAPNASKERLETALESVRTQLVAYCHQVMPGDVEWQIRQIVTQ